MLKRKERHARRIVSKSVKRLEIIAARPLSKYPERVQQHNYAVPESVQSSRSNDLVISDQISTYNESINSESSVESTFQNIDCQFPEIGEEAHKAKHRQRNPTITNFRNDLKHWALTHQIKQNALTHLLHILKPNHYTDLPNDARSLLKTPRTTLTREVPPGNYCHIGATERLKQIIARYPNNTTLILDINIDGLPVSRSSNSQLWPIQAHIINFPSYPPFVIGLYHGLQKPKCANNYLAEFVSECSELLQSGLKHENKEYTVKINKFVCDTPARTFITCAKGHNAYYGCGKCDQKGTYYKGRVTFSSVVKTLRTDYSFKNQLQKNHHNGESTLVDLGIGMVTQFPDDPMHLLYLGMFIVVEFHSRKGDTKVETVPHSWLKSDNFSISWPPSSKSMDFVSKAIAAKKTPENNWTTFEISKYWGPFG
ncbi:unnamed protein product [Allacma fusca]|uniref:Uncharacterized protein n=1 Tax=Allacma fusca TaxID=39272 RepID=A0A8J2JWP4_9HEXA|nr:unnamed protein product [Allacma fusca]